ncbi:MAG TPA: hypothetical protein PK020_03900 [Ilumatobacteraceae bacterium]|nr:hypothetical protein [Ilumatobacteraceae bacterium]
MSATEETLSTARTLAMVYALEWPQHVKEVLLAPAGMGTTHDLETALELFGPLPEDLLPLAAIDEASLAVVALNDRPNAWREGEVFRWFVTDVAPQHQLAPLDIDPLIYISSLDAELGHRAEGLKRVLDEIGPAYQDAYLAKEKRPRDFVVRPVRIACQNVIVALAAFSQESSFDGLAVVAWQTCEVPHVATHEANRALAALTLCDAFQNGGTMEIRFDRRVRSTLRGRTKDYDGHPEGQVPASLRRFGRTVGVRLGVDDAAAISPREARELFLAITPMPAHLRERVDDAVAHQGITPERICFLLLSQVWREIELDYLLSTSCRARSIVGGGADWTDRLGRQAESEVCRGAVMAGMLHRRLNATDAAAADEEATVRVVEDRTKGIDWQLHEAQAAITFFGLDPSERVPWTLGRTGIDALTVFPRTAATAAAVHEVAHSDLAGPKALLVPADSPMPTGDLPVIVLRCPDRLADIDKNVEDRLLKSRISRG